MSLPGVTFSSLEKFIINPILTLRAPLPPMQQQEQVKFGAIIKQGFDSLIAARVVAVFASLFAATDAVVHFGTGVAKMLCFQGRSIVFAHFRQAFTFAGLAAVLSVAAVVWPDVVRYCRYTPHAPSDACDDAPQHIKNLAERIEKGHETSPFHQVKEVWNKSKLEERHWIVQLLSQNDSNRFSSVRTAIKDTVYQSVTTFSRQVEWISPQEIDTRIGGLWQQASVYNHSFFYHATSEANLESILKSKKIEVRHEKAFRGAFVSTTPETSFGRCILAFKKNIERLSLLEHGFQRGNSYWAGFSRSIPVTASTLAYIILDGGSPYECQTLQERCRSWFDKPISVISLHEANEKLSAIHRLNMGIPHEWPSNRPDDSISKTIFATLQARAVENRQVSLQLSLLGQLATLVQRADQWAYNVLVSIGVIRQRQALMLAH